MSTAIANPDYGCPLLQEGPPEWASGYGQDSYGYFIELELPISGSSWKTGVQRLRWIPAGEFWMGSAESEAGRREDELRHRVRLSQGYWLFDSACPQWLWTSVMGSNPSRFQDDFRPVECVSWDDCQEFLSRLNERLGVSGVFRLPTEAEWEYACRGGSESAIYTGALTIRGENDGPELDEVAWYGGNSGVGYDLAEGYDGSSWSEKQYSFSKCGSRRVKAKLSNPWGLYDMLGNVYEWCSDWYGDYDSELCVDPIGVAAGSLRVVRGGGWSSHARRVRSAYRDWLLPRDAIYYLGLRPLRVQRSAQDR